MPTLSITVLLRAIIYWVWRRAGGEKALPLVIFVDLNMPAMAAPEFLEWLRSHPRLEHLLVFILTASENPADMQLAQELGSTAHFVKPLELRELAERFFE